MIVLCDYLPILVESERNSAPTIRQIIAYKASGEIEGFPSWKNEFAEAAQFIFVVCWHWNFKMVTGVKVLLDDLLIAQVINVMLNFRKTFSHEFFILNVLCHTFYLASKNFIQVIGSKLELNNLV